MARHPGAIRKGLALCSQPLRNTRIDGLLLKRRHTAANDELGTQTKVDSAALK
jgi:hypothetical protein